MSFLSEKMGVGIKIGAGWMLKIGAVELRQRLSG